MNDPLTLIVGLGNPGTRYAGTRHNAGRMALGAIAERWSFSKPDYRCKGHLALGKVSSHRVGLFAPDTFMNLSGPPVAEVARFFQVPASQVVLMHDEIDLPLGKTRLTIGGTSGHNGMRSVRAHMGDAYRRVRIGVGHPGNACMVHSHVLNPFTAEELSLLPLDAIAEHVALLAAGEDATFANRLVPS